MIAQLTKRYEKRCTVARTQQGDDDWQDDKLETLISWLEAQHNKIPFIYRESARCEMEVIDHRDLPYVRMTITFRRMETNDEMQERVTEEQEYDEALKEHELRLLEKLERKYRQAT